MGAGDDELLMKLRCCDTLTLPPTHTHIVEHYLVLLSTIPGICAHLNAR